MTTVMVSPAGASLPAELAHVVAISKGEPIGPEKIMKRPIAATAPARHDRYRLPRRSGRRGLSRDFFAFDLTRRDARDLGQLFGQELGHVIGGQNAYQMVVRVDHRQPADDFACLLD